MSAAPTPIAVPPEPSLDAAPTPLAPVEALAAPAAAAAPPAPRKEKAPVRERMQLASTGVKVGLLAYYLVVLAGTAVLADATSARRHAEGWDRPAPAAVVAPAAGGAVPAVAVPPAPPAGYDPLVVLTLLAGVVGGALHGLASMSFHAGRGAMYRSWWMFYVSRPFVGGGLAAVVYLVLRSGLAGFQVQPPAGFHTLLAWGALAGLFSTPAMRKLRDVFDAVFRSSDHGRGPQQRDGAQPRP